MIRIIILILLVVVIDRVFNGGFEVKVNGEKYSLEVEQGQ